MKKLAVFIIVSIGCLALFADTVSYSYDQAGNRIKREIVLSQFRMSPSESYTDMLSDKEVRIYPNPTKGILKVEIDDYEETAGYSLYLYSTSGKLLLSPEVSSCTYLDLSGYANGIYILTLELDGSAKTWKIVKN